MDRSCVLEKYWETIINTQIIPTYPLQLIQISDCHLFSDSSSCLLGMNTFESFKAVLGAIKEQWLADLFKLEALLITGDISQDESFNSYQLFLNELEQFNRQINTDIYIQRGNHDDWTQMDLALKAHHGKMNSQNRRSKIEMIKKKQLNEHWQLIPIETPVKGETYGHVSPEGMKELTQQLKEDSSYALFAMHHHLLDVDCEWFHPHRLKNQAELLAAITPFLHAKAVIHGHIHQASDQSYALQNGMLRVLSAPSTSIQFKPNSKAFQLDELGPGWRLIELHSTGDMTTELFRLSPELFPVDLSGEGY